MLLPRVARYARGRDYHKVMERKLKALARALLAEQLCSQARAYVDTGPVLERAWTEAAGLGWLGKNACLIHPRLGSYLVLGEVLVDAPLPADAPMPSFCGTCSRCLEACPTGALVAPGVLDPTRCIAAWTIEEKGALTTERQTACRGWVAGCDTCQEVCPHNAPRRIPPGDPELTAPQPWHGLSLAEVAQLSRSEYECLFRGSPLRRVGWEGLRRGAARVGGAAP